MKSETFEKASDLMVSIKQLDCLYIKESNLTRLIDRFETEDVRQKIGEEIRLFVSKFNSHVDDLKKDIQKQFDEL